MWDYVLQNLSCCSAARALFWHLLSCCCCQGPALTSAPPAAARALFQSVGRAWEAGLTPGAVIRGLGPLGPRLIHGYVNSRFGSSTQGQGRIGSTGSLTPDEADIFKHYFYHIISAPGRCARACMFVRACACVCACVHVWVWVGGGGGIVVEWRGTASCSQTPSNIPSTTS